MRRAALVTAVVLGLVPLGATPALARTADVTRASCAAQHGTFTWARGVRTCTVTATRQDTEDVVGATGPVERVDGSTVQYSAYSQRVTTVETTTRRSQRGHARVRTAVSERVVSSEVVRLYCLANVYDSLGNGGTVTMPDADCESRGLFRA